MLLFVSLLAAASAAPAQVSPAADLAGLWAQLQHAVAQVDIPVLGKRRAITDILLLTRIFPTPTGLRTIQQMCDMRTEKVLGEKTLFTRHFTDSAPHMHTRWTVDPPDAKPRRFHQNATPQVLGAHLKHGLTDPLPTLPTDPRVYDMDHDGKPGATVRMRGLFNGDVYVVSRSTGVFEGVIAADGKTMSGSLYWTNEQKVLDSNSWVLRRPVISKQDRDRPSTVKLVRLKLNATCEEIRRRSTELFPGMLPPVPMED